MTYQEKFVAAVKCNGAVLREKDSTVTIPFGSEYSIFLKNLDSRDALIKVTIDGQDVLDGNGLIIRGNSSSEINGFMKGSKFKNKFKFIKKTKEAIASGKMTDEPDDGIIRIEYTFTKQLPEEITKYINKKVNIIPDFWYDWYDWYPFRPRLRPYYSPPYYTSISYTPDLLIGSTLDDCCKLPVFGNDVKLDGGPNTTWSSTTYQMTSENGDVVSEFKASQNSSGENSITYRGPAFASAALPEPNEDEGKTVKGDKINEKTKKAFINDLENNSHVIILKLKGTVAKEKIIADSSGTSATTVIEDVTKPVTTKDKIYCTSCGKANKTTSNFCSNCGERLEVCIE